MLRNKKNRRSSRGSGRPLASKRAATQKLQRATAAPSSSPEAQRAIAPSPEDPPSLPAILAAPASSLSRGTFTSFASPPSSLFSMPSFASGSSPEQLIEESTTLSVFLEAHAAAHKSFAQVLRSKVVGLETRPSPLPASANETPLPSKVIGLEEASLVVPPAATSITTSLTTPTPTTGETAASYPRESIDSIAARDEFCQDPRCRPFFAPSIYNLCFFFEEGDESFDAANGASKLDKLGPFSAKRWRHLKCIHCILPNSDRGQAYIARTGAHTHYQGLFQDFVSSLENDSGFTPVQSVTQAGITPMNFLLSSTRCRLLNPSSPVWSG